MFQSQSPGYYTGMPQNLAMKKKCKNKQETAMFSGLHEKVENLGVPKTSH